MFYYGGTQTTKLTRDVLSCILNCLAEEHWYKLKFNQKILKLMCSLRKKDKAKNLARHGFIESLYGFIESLAEREADLSGSIFGYICEYGSLDLVRRFEFEFDQMPNWNYGLKGACRGRHRHLVDLAISKGANDWALGLMGACRGGNREIVDLMITKGACHWNLGFDEACLGGHEEIVMLMIRKGAILWHGGLNEACRGGNKAVVDLVISNGYYDWNYGLHGACRRGHKNIVELMISKGADDWNYGLSAACRGSHLEIMNLMIDKGATKCENCGSKHNFRQHRSI